MEEPQSHKVRQPLNSKAQPPGAQPGLLLRGEDQKMLLADRHLLLFALPGGCVGSLGQGRDPAQVTQPR